MGPDASPAAAAAPPEAPAGFLRRICWFYSPAELQCRLSAATTLEEPTAGDSDAARGSADKAGGAGRDQGGADRDAGREVPDGADRHGAGGERLVRRGA